MRKEKEMDLIMQKALASEIAPDKSINDKIIREWEKKYLSNPAGNPGFRKEVKFMGKRKIGSLAAAAALFILAVSSTVFAAVKYLTEDEIVSELGNDAAQDAFQGEESLELDETLEAGDYRFKLYGVTTKEALINSGFKEDMVREGGTYIVLSIEHLDGEPMPDTSSDAYNNLHFFISPLIQGLEPWQYNMGSMGGAHSTIVRGGVLYRMIQCDDIALFADRQIYLCITDTDFYETEAYNYSESDGTITRNEAYEGMNLLMELPIDPKRADEKKAQEYLAKLQESWEIEPEEAVAGENGIVSTNCRILDDIILKEREKDSSITTWKDIPLETLLGYAELKEDSIQEVTGDENGVVKFSYKDGDGFTNEIASSLGDDFLEGNIDVVLLGCAYSEDDAEFWVARRDENGKVKCMLYFLKE